MSTVAESDPATIEQFHFAAAARVKPWSATKVTCSYSASVSGLT
jgi:hypothetical protein